MFFLLSKVLFYLVAPAVWLLLFLLLALVARDAQKQRRRLRAAALLALIGTNPLLPNELLKLWELPPRRLAELPRQADAAVLLTGIAESQELTDRVYLGPGADRFTNALWLYRAGRVRRIIITGGSGSVLRKARTEADELRILLRLSGVPASAILLEEKSHNTRENALYTKELLATRPELDTLILVTSAFHQRRALGCFRKVGLHPISFPADYRSSPRQITPDYWAMPSADALTQWTLLLHEVLGWTTYKLLGYA